MLIGWGLLVSMAGKSKFVWIRVLRSDKDRVWAYFKRKGVTNAAMIFKALARGKK